MSPVRDEKALRVFQKGTVVKERMGNGKRSGSQMLIDPITSQNRIFKINSR
jgi:hypothetical protein